MIVLRRGITVVVFLVVIGLIGRTVILQVTEGEDTPSPSAPITKQVAEPETGWVSPANFLRARTGTIDPADFLGVQEGEQDASRPC